MGGFERAIFSTIAYYDYFNYPLTAAEIYQYLVKINPKSQFSNSNQIPNSKIQTSTICHPERSDSEVEGSRRLRDCIAISRDSSVARLPQNDSKKLNLFEIINILDESENLKKFISQKNGFYFLKGREEIIEQRIQRKKLADEKFKKSKWILKIISYLPFTRLIMMSGTMAVGNPHKESDVDLLVVAKAGRIWTARAILTFFAMLFGKYRHTGETENRLCLNHYITDKSLAIDFGNLYKAEEYLNLIPVAGDLNIYKSFFKENVWIKDYTYSASGSLEKNLRTAPLQGVSLRIKKFFEFLLSGLVGDHFEKYVKKFQVYFIEKNPLTKSPHARVRYDDNNLVFHPVLIEPEVIARWEEKMMKFNNF